MGVMERSPPRGLPLVFFFVPFLVVVRASCGEGVLLFFCVAVNHFETMGSLLELQEMLIERDDRIKQLEAVVKVRDNEIMELKSQLDKFQSVIPYATIPAGVSVSKVRARKTRATGISAEPQTLKTAQELVKLGQTTFPVIAKDAR